MIPRNTACSITPLFLKDQIKEYTNSCRKNLGKNCINLYLSRETDRKDL